MYHRLFIVRLFQNSMCASLTSQLFLILLAIACTSCAEKKNSPTENEPRASAAASAEAPPPVPLEPRFQMALECLSACKTIWSFQHDASPNPPPKGLPYKFSAFVDKKENGEKFEGLLKQLPEEFWPIGQLLPTDFPIDESERDSTFGDIKGEPPELYGEMDSIIELSGEKYYIYKGIHYNRISDARLGWLDVAVRGRDRAMAVILNRGSSLDEYHLRGDSSVQPVLLAHKVISELHSAARQLKHEQDSAKGKELDWSGNDKPALPQNPITTDAVSRIAILSQYLAQSGSATQVPAPSDMEKASVVRQERGWYGVNQDHSKCMPTPMSPAERIELIQSAGVVPVVRDRSSGGKVVFVEVSGTDGGHTTTWRYWKVLSDCEAALPQRVNADRYR